MSRTEHYRIDSVPAFARTRHDSSQSCERKWREAISRRRKRFAFNSILQGSKLANSIFKKAREAPFDISLTVAGNVVRIMHILAIGEAE